MSRSEAKLLLQLLKYANQTSKSMKNSGCTDVTLGFLNAVKDAFQNNMEKYGKFVKVLRDFSAKRIYIGRLKAKLKILFKGHQCLISEFNSLVPMKHGITLLLDNGQLGELPWDVLDIICKTLDFDDLFSFSRVCKNWRTFHISNFLSSQEPLLLRNTGYHTDSYSFTSIPNQKVYDLNMMSCFKHPKFTYVRFSSGYFIMTCENNSFVLFNPFTTIKREIHTPFTVNSHFYSQYEALLAFEKGFDEYVLVVLCLDSSCLYVYQSRYDGWVSYSTLNPEEVVVSFVVSNNIIYVVTKNAKIGVLNLNSGTITFLNLQNTPKIEIRPPSLNTFKIDPSKRSFKLVTCDEQLLVIDFRSLFRREAYKIDFSTMNYVKMKSLGNLALFYVYGKNCQALSNPERFGYKSNHVYEADYVYYCVMYDWNKGDKSKIYPHQPGPLREFTIFDWCFRYLEYEVDYSLVE